MNHFEKIEESDFGNVEEIFRSFFNEAKYSEDKTEIINLTKAEAKQGTSKMIKILTSDICEECNGKKDIKCSKCFERGYYFSEKSIELNLPPKIKENDYILIKEQGNIFEANQKRGNLYIKIHIYGEKSKRKGNKIYEK